ncbi:MAG TPA: carbonic anhydrase family protein [Flavobacterium sp.]|nr:carbonic anhydrase family protein [Flavobacterium sp.]
MKKIIKHMLLVVAALAFVACNQQQNTAAEPLLVTAGASEQALEHVLSKQEQMDLTADGVIAQLKEGNRLFRSNQLTARDYSQQVKNAAEGQYPEAIILSCVDSRVPVESVFNKGIGDLFVARVAGNFVNEDMLGSMEFACKVSGSKLIVVLGHGNCGAVRAAIDGVELGNITAMLQKIRPAVDDVDYGGARTGANQEFVDLVCHSNILHTINQIRSQSPILKEMEDNQEIKIVGAIYDMDSGEVSWLEVF